MLISAPTYVYFINRETSMFIYRENLESHFIKKKKKEKILFYTYISTFVICTFRLRNLRTINDDINSALINQIFCLKLEKNITRGTKSFMVIKMIRFKNTTEYLALI